MGCASSSDKDDFKIQKLKTETLYDRLKTLGSGASCKVYSVEHKQTKKRFAMKVMEKNHQDNKTLFENEYKILRVLNHPNIVEFVSAYEDEKSFHLLTVLCQGGDLFDRVSTMRKFSEKAASALTKQMLLALEFCHQKHIVHRDLKPENFVFDKPPSDTEESNLRLIDFGCAVQKEDHESVGDVAGSPYYVAPEVLEADYPRTGETWKASDIWSIGVIVYLLLHGYPPFNAPHGQGERAIYAKIREGSYRFSRNIKLSDQAKNFIMRILKKKPSLRPSATELLNDPWIKNPPDNDIDPKVLKALGDFNLRFKLQRAVGRVLAQNMTSSDKEVLKSIFKQYDKDGNGYLDAYEVADMMKDMGKSPADAKEFMEAFDQNRDGTLDLDEFKDAYGAVKAENASEDEVRAAFSTLDKDKSGAISINEVQQFCQVSREEAQSMIKEMDKNGDNQISFDELMAALQKKSAGKYPNNKKSNSGGPAAAAAKPKAKK